MNSLRRSGKKVKNNIVGVGKKSLKRLSNSFKNINSIRKKLTKNLK